MLVTTTPSLDGRPIAEYRGIVFGEVIVGIDFIKDIAAGLTNIFGGRSSSYEGELIQARASALNEMQQRALLLDADAVVGVRIDYETLGQAGTMIMVTASGTAVKLA
jgi:uncharacterized protein YbjQ (UPF0145 family)